MLKTDHKGIASQLVKGLIDNQADTPMQESYIVRPIPTNIKTDKFTVEIESSLMEEVRLYGVKNKMKLRKIFEESLKEYLAKR